MSRLFGETLRQAPATTDTAGYALLLRAGYLRQVAPGISSYLPLGLRALSNIESVVRRELGEIGAQEISMPLVQPATLWERSGRLAAAGDELVRFTDRGGRTLVLATTHEETVVELARTEIRSYRQLPVTLYRIAPVFRDEAAPRGGPLRAREFRLLAAYSFDRDPDRLVERHDRQREAFLRFFGQLGLENVVVATANDAAGEEGGEELAWLCDAGDDRLARCTACGYAANRRWARFRKPQVAQEMVLPAEKVATPGADTIAALIEHLDISPARTAKAVFYTATRSGPKDRDSGAERVVLALVRGDMEVSEPKLCRAAGVYGLAPARAEAIRAVGAEPGYASPIGVDLSGTRVIVDDLVARSTNLVSGANEPGFHIRNANYGRDFSGHVVADIAEVYPGAPCPECDSPLEVVPCVEIGSLHRFGRSFAERLGASFQDEDGTLRPLAIGSYGVGIDRLLACIAEARRDEHGLRLPASVAPYAAYLIAITGGDSLIAEQAERLYRHLEAEGIPVLFDDREASPGVKFNDADLIGVPIRATLGGRSLAAGGIELKARGRAERRVVGLDRAVEEIAAMLAGWSETGA